jgi:hypothetical protein
LVIYRQAGRAKKDAADTSPQRLCCITHTLLRFAASVKPFSRFFKPREYFCANHPILRGEGPKLLAPWRVFFFSFHALDDTITIVSSFQPTI